MKTRMMFCFALAVGMTLAQAQSASSKPQAPQAGPPAQAPPSVSAGPGAGKATQAIPPQKPGELGSALAPTDAVITIKGLCTGTARPVVGRTAEQKPASAASSQACTTVITKEQFDALVDSLGRPIPAGDRQKLAQNYVELLAVADAAKKAGIEKSPKYEEAMQLARLQKLAELYSRDLQDQYHNPPAEEVEAYYQQNLAKYEEVKLQRIFIPKNNPSGEKKEDFEKKAQDVANEIRERAVKGEDPEELQKEAYKKLGLTTTPMKTDMGSKRRGMFPAQLEAEIFSLKAGEVSKVENEAPGYMIYKVNDERTAPLEEVKNDISRDIFQQKMTSTMKGITSAVRPDFNPKYFGPTNAPATAIPSALPAAPASVKPSAPAPATPAPGAAKPPAAAPEAGQPH
jgi:hypothetical protein